MKLEPSDSAQTIPASPAPAADLWAIRSVAPAWHTALLVVVVLAFSILSARSQHKFSATHGRAVLYAITMGWEWLICGYILFGMHRRRVKLSELVAGQWKFPQDVLVDIFLAVGFWFAAATVLALLLGGMVSFALYQFSFFGRDAISLLLVLPIALPGIITGVALNSFFSFTGIPFSALTIVAGHATFCIVVVFNNLIARLRRMPGSLTEASMDLGARGWQTLRYVFLPLSATALVSGALLAFALSFDEVIVTIFTAGAQNTLPLWIFGAIRLGQQLPEVNAVVTIVILLTLLPVVLAARIAGTGAINRSSRSV